MFIPSDHFNKTTIKRLAKERPTLRFACGMFLAYELLDLGVKEGNIDIVVPNVKYDYKDFLIEPVKLNHDVENYGYKILINGKKILYATDTVELNFKAKNYDLYLIEGNFENEEELHSRAENEYYENRVKNTHLSKEKCNLFLIENAKEESIFEYLHEHKDK